MATHKARGGKIRTILIVVFFLMIIGLIIFWIVSGGPQRAWEVGKNFSNPIAYIFGAGSTTASLIKLPWQPTDVRGPDISDYVQAADQQQSAANTDGGTSGGQTDTSRLQQFGTPSPYQGQVTISGDNLSSDPTEEYIVLEANDTNQAPIAISGWTLESSVSGRENFIPQANTKQVVLLAPGQTAYIVTGTSATGATLEQNTLRLYFSMRTNLWNPDHDVIRLLDNEQRVVDVLSY